MNAQNKSKKKRKAPNRINERTNITLDPELKEFGNAYADATKFKSLSALVSFGLQKIREGMSPEEAAQATINAGQLKAPFSVPLATGSPSPKSGSHMLSGRASLKDGKRNVLGE